MADNNTNNSNDTFASFDTGQSGNTFASYDTAFSHNQTGDNNKVADNNTVASDNTAYSHNNVGDYNNVADNNSVYDGNQIADGNKIDDGNTVGSDNTAFSHNELDSGNVIGVGNQIDDGNKIGSDNTYDSDNKFDSGNTVNSDNTLTITPPMYSNDSNSFNTHTTNITNNWGEGSQDLEHALSNFNNSDGSLLFMPETYDLGITGGGTDSIIALDQVNSLVANDGASSISLSNSGDHLFDGNDIANGANGGVADSHVGPSGTETGASSATAGVTANLDALTQSIVLGANIQYNNFNLSVIGGNSTASASVTDDSSSSHGHSGHTGGLS